MEFNIDTGALVFSEKLTLSPLMTREQVLNQNVVWEEWYVKNNQNFRTFLKIKNGKNEGEEIIVIIHFDGISPASSKLGNWDFAPRDNRFDGEQSKPEGKFTKKIRGWFKEMTSISLPAYNSLGHIDAAYDPHNNATSIVCNCRAGFKDEKSWWEFCERNGSG